MLYDGHVKGHLKMMSTIKGWAVALTCYLSHSVKHSKMADSNPPGSRNALNQFCNINTTDTDDRSTADMWPTSKMRQ